MPPFSCTRIDDPAEAELSELTDSEATRSGYIANTDNPYSYKNISKAYDQVVDVMGIRPSTIRPTHEYVRFMVRDTTQFDILYDSLGMILFRQA